MAYAARYGRQPLSEIRAMTMAELGEFCEDIAAIVRQENGDGRED